MERERVLLTATYHPRQRGIEEDPLRFRVTLRDARYARSRRSDGFGTAALRFYGAEDIVAARGTATGVAMKSPPAKMFLRCASVSAS